MGVYLNPGSERFAEAVVSEVFVDKAAMVAYLSSCVRTNKKYVCVSRSRRFGKTMAATTRVASSTTSATCSWWA